VGHAQGGVQRGGLCVVLAVVSVPGHQEPRRPPTGCGLLLVPSQQRAGGGVGRTHVSPLVDCERGITQEAEHVRGLAVWLVRPILPRW